VLNGVGVRRLKSAEPTLNYMNSKQGRLALDKIYPVQKNETNDYKKSLVPGS
jgi:hypothetical protein